MREEIQKPPPDVVSPVAEVTRESWLDPLNLKLGIAVLPLVAIAIGVSGKSMPWLVYLCMGLAWLILLRFTYESKVTNSRLLLLLWVVVLIIWIPVTYWLASPPLMRVVFKNPAHIGIYRRYRIRYVVTNYVDYLKDVGFYISSVVPPMGIAEDNGEGGAIGGEIQTIVLSRKEIKEDKYVVWIYSHELFLTILAGINPHGNSPELKRRIWLSGIWATYYTCSYLNHCDFENEESRHPLVSALLEMRKHFGQVIMDQVMIVTLQAIDNHIGDQSESVESYFGHKLIAGVVALASTKEDAEYALTVLKKYNITLTPETGGEHSVVTERD